MNTPDTAWEAGHCLMTPLHGVCEIVERCELEILGQVQVFYVLRPLDEPGLLKLPQKMLEPGVRPLLPAEVMRDALRADVEEGDVPLLRPHQRMEAWLSDLKRGDPLVRKRVLRQMGQVRLRERKLTPPEEALCERVRSAFKREVEMVLEVDEDTAVQMVDDAVRIQVVALQPVSHQPSDDSRQPAAVSQQAES